jgi:hypothetical protein
MISFVFFLIFKILTYIEKVKANQTDIDKYKLLINENDMILNLILKHCQKLATIQNAINLIKFSASSNNNDVTHLYEQEFNQTQRKKDETCYLKEGIDKRAKYVKEFLKK